MLEGFLANIIALLPWTLGAALGLRAARVCIDIPGFSAIAAGIGGFLGYMFVALALWLADQYGISLLNNAFLIGLGMLTVLAIAGLWPIKKSELLAWPRSPLTFFLAGLLLLYTGYWLCVSANLPAQGWDVLDHWGAVATRFIEHSLSEPTEPYAYRHWRIHPKTTGFILAWSAWCGNLYSTSAVLVWSIPWLGFSLSTALLVAGWSYNQTRNIDLSLVLVLLVITIPLLENHALIVGYAELPLALGLMAGTILTALAFQERSQGIFVAAMFISLTPIFLKNTGPAYALAPIIASVFTISAVSDIRKLAAFTFLSTIICIYIWNEGFSLRIADIQLGYDATAQSIKLGARALEITAPSWPDVLANELQSRLLNSSFSIGLLAVCLLLILTISANARPISAPILVVTATFTILLAQQFLSQFTEYGFKFAAPDRDTGLSRFSLAAFMLVPTVIATFFRPEIFQKNRNQKHIKSLVYRIPAGRLNRKNEKSVT